MMMILKTEVIYLTVIVLEERLKFSEINSIDVFYIKMFLPYNNLFSSFILLAFGQAICCFFLFGSILGL